MAALAAAQVVQVVVIMQEVQQPRLVKDLTVAQTLDKALLAQLVVEAVQEVLDLLPYQVWRVTADKEYTQILQEWVSIMQVAVVAELSAVLQAQVVQA
jgi:hypothetical protein